MWVMYIVSSDLLDIPILSRSVAGTGLSSSYCRDIFSAALDGKLSSWSNWGTILDKSWYISSRILVGIRSCLAIAAAFGMSDTGTLIVELIGCQYLSRNCLVPSCGSKSSIV